MADEAQGGEADGGRHATDLAVLALVDLQLDPRGRDVGAVPDGGRALPRRRVVRQEPGFGGAGGEDLALGFQMHGALERAEVGGARVDLVLAAHEDSRGAEIWCEDFIRWVGSDGLRVERSVFVARLFAARPLHERGGHADLSAVSFLGVFMGTLLYFEQKSFF